MALNLDPCFGHWLAGFTDGEGCFRIIKHPQRNYFACSFEIKLRSDDELILEDICGQLGVGNIYHQAYRVNSYGVKSCSTVTLRFASKSECAVIQDVFRTFPLRAKKAEDCLIWCKAVDCWITHKRGDSWSDMAVLKEQLDFSRGFKE
jgi:hypothetical protein